MSAEVARAVAGMGREEAEGIVKRLVPLYEPGLKEANIGKPFDQVYDVVLVHPTAEWQGIYDEVKDELAELGVPF